MAPGGPLRRYAKARRTVAGMTKRIAFPEQKLPSKLTFDPEAGMDDESFYDFCVANPDLRVERTAQGEILIVPPAGGESDYRNVKALTRLSHWAERDGRGKVFGPSAAFILPTRAILSPDAAWVSNGRLQPLSREQRRKFLPVCPEFVIEVMSPSDRLPDAIKKMQEWIAAGVELAWLIHGDEETVYVFRPGRQEAETCAGVDRLAGEGPVAGFELPLQDIWAGL